MLFKTMPTSQITPNLYAVCTKYVNFYVYKDERFTLCIDTGIDISTIRQELQKIPIVPQDVTHIFLTHSDSDHVGGVTLFSQANVYLSKLEEPVINGAMKRSIFAKNLKLARPYETLSDEKIITIGSIEVQAISTPGHTTGSMSYVINKTILFVGDTIALKKDKATTGHNFMNMNKSLQKESMIKLSKLNNISLLCTGHTGISKNFDSVMKEWRHSVSNGKYSTLKHWWTTPP